MNCRQARQKLIDSDWVVNADSGNGELLSHLESCADCRTLLQAESAISGDIAQLRVMPPESNITVDSLREVIVSGNYGTARNRPGSNKVPLAGHHAVLKRYSIAFASLAFFIIAFVPINFKEKVGYEITIAGVDKDIVTENTDITPLLQALGMQQETASSLLDSLGSDRARLYLGECRETCQLHIGDLKTERDVKLVVKAIIELGCCQIEKIVPVFRDETSSLLKYAAKKLYS